MPFACIFLWDIAPHHLTCRHTVPQFEYQLREIDTTLLKISNVNKQYRLSYQRMQTLFRVLSCHERWWHAYPPNNIADRTRTLVSLLPEVANEAVRFILNDLNFYELNTAC